MLRASVFAFSSESGRMVRMAFCAGKNNKPSILITAEHEIYLGNLGNEDLLVQQGELFGFLRTETHPGSGRAGSSDHSWAPRV